MKLEEIENIGKTQEKILNDLRPIISRKLAFALEDKIKGQQQELQRHLGLVNKQSANLSRYTLILDSQYFEQQFLN